MKDSNFYTLLMMIFFIGIIAIMIYTAKRADYEKRYESMEADFCRYYGYEWYNPKWNYCEKTNYEYYKGKVLTQSTEHSGHLDETSPNDTYYVYRKWQIDNNYV